MMDTSGQRHQQDTTNNPEQMTFVLAWAYQEVANRQFKYFGCLSMTYSHDPLLAWIHSLFCQDLSLLMMTPTQCCFDW